MGIGLIRYPNYVQIDSEILLIKDYDFTTLTYLAEDEHGNERGISSQQKLELIPLSKILNGYQLPLKILLNDKRFLIQHYSDDHDIYSAIDDQKVTYYLNPVSQFHSFYLENNMEFESGAVRSQDADHVAYNAISPIALEYVVQRYPRMEHGANTIESMNCVLENLTLFLKESQLDYLVYAACHSLDAAQFQYGPLKTEGLGYEILPYYGLRSLALRHAEGNAKYGFLNWELGMPIHDLLNHAIKHCFDFLHDKTDDPNEIGGIIWGCFAAIHSFVLWPELNKAFLRESNCTIGEAVRNRLKKG